jgi:hypothetical protein
MFVDPWGLDYSVENLSADNQSKFINIVKTATNDDRYYVDENGLIQLDSSRDNGLGKATVSASVINSIIANDSLIELKLSDSQTSFTPEVMRNGKKVAVSANSYWQYSNEETRLGTIYITQSMLDGESLFIGSTSSLGGEAYYMSPAEAIAHESTHASSWLYRLENNLIRSGGGGKFFINGETFIRYQETLAILVSNHNMLQLGKPITELDGRGVGYYFDNVTGQIYAGNGQYGNFGSGYIGLRCYTHEISNYYKNEMWKK